MNTIWGAELHYAPDYWPLWLIYAGVVVLLMLVGWLSMRYCAGCWRQKRRAAKSIVTISTRWRFAVGIGEMRYCLFYYC